MTTRRDAVRSHDLSRKWWLTHGTRPILTRQLYPPSLTLPIRFTLNALTSLCSTILLTLFLPYTALCILTFTLTHPSSTPWTINFAKSGHFTHVRFILTLSSPILIRPPPPTSPLITPSPATAFSPFLLPAPHLHPAALSPVRPASQPPARTSWINKSAVESHAREFPSRSP